MAVHPSYIPDEEELAQPSHATQEPFRTEKPKEPVRIRPTVETVGEEMERLVQGGGDYHGREALRGFIKRASRGRR